MRLISKKYFNLLRDECQKYHDLYHSTKNILEVEKKKAEKIDALQSQLDSIKAVKPEKVYVTTKSFDLEDNDYIAAIALIAVSPELRFMFISLKEDLIESMHKTNEPSEILAIANKIKGLELYNEKLNDLLTVHGVKKQANEFMENEEVQI